jgi:hypothetical protein
MKIIMSENFSEFMRFFPKGVNPFKIQTSIKLDLFLEFIIQNPEGFGSWAKREILDIRNVMICIFEV